METKKRNRIKWSSIVAGVVILFSFMGWTGSDVIDKYQRWGDAIESVESISKVLARDTIKLKITLLMLRAELDSVKSKKGGNAKKLFPAVRNITYFLLEEMDAVHIGNITLYLDKEKGQHYHLFNGLLYEAYVTPSRKIYWIDWNRKEQYLN